MTAVGIVLCCTGAVVVVGFVLALALGLCRSAAIADERMDEEQERRQRG